MKLLFLVFSFLNFKQLTLIQFFFNKNFFNFYYLNFQKITKINSSYKQNTLILAFNLIPTKNLLNEELINLYSNSFNFFNLLSILLIFFISLIILLIVNRWFFFFKLFILYEVIFFILIILFFILINSFYSTELFIYIFIFISLGAIEIIFALSILLLKVKKQDLKLILFFKKV